MIPWPALAARSRCRNRPRGSSGEWPPSGCLAGGVRSPPEGLHNSAGRTFSLLAHARQESDLARGKNAHALSSHPKAAVHVEEPAAVFIEATGKRGDEACEVEAALPPRQGELSTVGVASKGQHYASACGLGEEVWPMGEQHAGLAGRDRGEQLREEGERIQTPGPVFAAIIEPDDV